VSAALLGLAGFVACLLLIVLRVPVAIAVGVSGAVGYGLLNGWPGVGFVMGTAAFEAVFPYGLSVVPLFILMGIFAARSGLSRALYDVFHAVLGHRPGGLRDGDHRRLRRVWRHLRLVLGDGCHDGQGGAARDEAAGLRRPAGGGFRRCRRHAGLLIPPSIILVVYGLLTAQSIGTLFMAALLPGMLATLLYMVAVVVQTRIDPTLGSPGVRLVMGQRWRALREVWGVALLFAAVVGGMYLGWFSPTEAAAVGAAGAFVRPAASYPYPEGSG
jgi:TRAP-type mannitol/chloroaromatic compound transport system permease large subunit